MASVSGAATATTAGVRGSPAASDAVEWAVISPIAKIAATSRPTPMDTGVGTSGAGACGRVRVVLRRVLISSHNNDQTTASHNTHKITARVLITGAAGMSACWSIRPMWPQSGIVRRQRLPGDAHQQHGQPDDHRQQRQQRTERVDRSCASSASFVAAYASNGVRRCRHQ